MVDLAALFITKYRRCAHATCEPDESDESVTTVHASAVQLLEKIMRPALARTIWQHLEAINAVAYFSPESREAADRLGWVTRCWKRHGQSSW